VGPVEIVEEYDPRVECAEEAVERRRHVSRERPAINTQQPRFTANLCGPGDPARKNDEP
jgi:hypothetical protein